MKRRQFLQQSGTLLLLLGSSQLAWGASMLAIRMWPSEDYTRVTIESDWPLQTQTHSLSAPDRFVVDISGMQLNEQFKQMSTLLQASDPYVSGIRVGQFQTDVVRIVFDLKQPIDSNTFTLDPIAEYKNRFVIDFKPVAEVDPLEQLVTEIDTELKEAIAEGNENEADLLGEWLEEQSQASKTPATSTGKPSPSQRPTTTSKVPAQQGKTPTNKPQQKPTTTGRLYIIAIDPGHGGEDPGAIGPKKTREKDVVLAIGKRLKTLIDKQPGMRAYMTRDKDFFVPLAKRVEKARNVKADIFISIHADAFTKSSAKGASVFALSEKGATSTTAKMLAAKENQSDLIGGVDVKTRDRQTANVLLSMSTAAQIKDSKKLGVILLKELKKFAHLHGDRVEQAGFAVLKAPDIPSILVETAFISNPQEEQLLKSTAHQQKLAQAMMTAIQSYLKETSSLAKG